MNNRKNERTGRVKRGRATIRGNTTAPAHSALAGQIESPKKETNDNSSVMHEIGRIRTTPCPRIHKVTARQLVATASSSHRVRPTQNTISFSFRFSAVTRILLPGRVRR